MTLNIIDISFLIVMALGIFQAFNQHFVGSVLQFLKFILAILLAFRFSLIFSKILETLLGISPSFTPVIGFIMSFIFALVGLYLLSIVLDIFVKAARLHSVMRALGIGLWVLVLVMGFSASIMLGEQAGWINLGTTEESIVYRYIYPIGQILVCKLSFFFPAVDNILSAIESIFMNMWNLVAGECYQPQ